MQKTSRSAEGSFRQARTALRLQRTTLPGHAVQLLADEVVERLARRLHPDGAMATAAVTLIATEDFCEALVSEDPGVAMQLIHQQMEDGIPLDTVYLGTLAVAARHLGEMWENDDLSFLQMSVAAGRIFEIMRFLRSQFAPSSLDSDLRQALFATVPGELHTLGITMAADMFRERGWEIDLQTGRDHEELLAAIAHRPYRIIGLSAGHRSSMMALARLVVALRITHPQAHVIVSGGIVADVPDLNALIRADTVLASGDDALALLDRLSAHH